MLRCLSSIFLSLPFFVCLYLSLSDLTYLTVSAFVFRSLSIPRGVHPSKPEFRNWCVCRDGIGGGSRETGVSQVCREKWCVAIKKGRKTQCQDQCLCMICPNLSLANQTMVPNKLN